MGEALTARREVPFFAALRAALVARDAEAEAGLLAVLPQLSPSRVPFVLAALGDFRTSGGADLIRQAMTAGGQDAQCAGLLALVKREGPGALPDVRGALGSADAVLRDYAFACLGVVGDASLWDEVHARFAAMVRRPAGTVHDAEHPSDRVAIVFLIGRADDRHRDLLVDQIRRDWRTIEKHRPELAGWLLQEWPQVHPAAGPNVEVPLPALTTEWERLRENPLITAEALPQSFLDSMQV